MDLGQLESRVDKLEDDVKPLLSLPTQMSMLIASTEKTNVSIDKLSERMEKHYVSKDVMQLTVDNATSKIRLWAITAFLVAIVTMITTGYTMISMIKGGTQ